MSPPSRFCSNCGTPADAASAHCARCGNVIAAGAPATAQRDVAASGSKRGMTSLVLGLVGCGVGGFFFLVCGGILAAIAIPNFVRQGAISRQNDAKANLEALWAAERAWAASHDGEFLDFYATPEDASDENLARLGVDLGTMHHEYEGYFDGDLFVIVASGNLDEDDSLDEWELTSDDPVALHVYDDIREISDYGEEVGYGGGYDEEEEQPSGEIGGIAGGPPGAGGLGLRGGVADPSSDLIARSESARANLRAIWEGQQAYKLGKKKFLPFEAGSDATWSALGMSGLPETAHHTYAAKVTGDELTITASANLDGDPFLDEWIFSSRDQVPLQVKNDALDLDLSELAKALGDLGAPAAKGGTQP